MMAYHHQAPVHLYDQGQSNAMGSTMHWQPTNLQEDVAVQGTLHMGEGPNTWPSMKRSRTMWPE
eukprot:6251374-Prorocentrum_lima.AAC.1